MELDDCAFPLLHDTILTSKPEKAFDGASWVLLVVPCAQTGHGAERPPEHQRRHLRTTRQGDRILGASDVRILVVGNPCNTNCLIAARTPPRSCPSAGLP